MHELTELIRQDMCPALGVTEPGAIAFVVATARKHTAGAVKHITLRLNSGMFKNAFTCGIPTAPRLVTATPRHWGPAGLTRIKGWNVWTVLPQSRHRPRGTWRPPVLSKWK